MAFDTDTTTNDTWATPAAPGWFRRLVLGTVAGGACFLYGLYGLVTQTAFLPGLKGGSPVLTGRNALDLAAAYFAGGAYMALRFAVEHRCRTERQYRTVYWAECLLLGGFIAAIVYVLLNVGSAT
jgi:hypothetical protein